MIRKVYHSTHCLILLLIHNNTWAGKPQYLQLVNKLDRPVDGYCVDVVGSGANIRFDMPLTAHNCKGPQVYFDEVIEFREDGTLFFPQYQGCITVMGNNETALPKNALMLKRCNAQEPFLIAKHFQHFKFLANKQIQLNDSDLCIVAGERSHTTFSPAHRWRGLYMDICEQAEEKLSQWQFIPAGVKQP